MRGGPKIFLAIFAVAIIFIIWEYVTEKHTEEFFSIVNKVSRKISVESDVVDKSDYSQLIDLKNFTFIISHESCRRKSEVRPKVLILVHSKPVNYVQRQVIRDSWGYSDPMSVIFFALGVTNDTKIQSLIDAENEWHQDIIQGNFLDTYRNLTYKAMMCMKFAVYHCQEADYILKTDDDAFVNTPFLYHSIINGPFFTKDTLILCQIMDGSPTIREESKWKVTFEEFPHEFYPAYCSGYSVLLSSDVVRRLYHEGQMTKYLFVDDAFMTGIVRKKIGVPITDNLNWHMGKDKMDQYLEGKSNATRRFLFTYPNLSGESITKLWNVTKNWTYK